MEKKLRIGKIPYVNLYPIYQTIQSKSDCAGYEFVEGVPSQLNRMLREGQLDVSPSSSIEYIRTPHLYQLIDGHSISCSGCIASILLFSPVPIENLNNKQIFVTSQSETSIALLQIVLKIFYRIDCNLIVTDKPENMEGAAFFLIGDDALRMHKKLSINNDSLLIYDLGELWADHTNLPFVFALWIARRDIYQDNYKRQLLIKFIADLDSARDSFRSDIFLISGSNCIRDFMTKEEVISYWNKISYNLTDSHKESLELFSRYLRQISYL